MTDVLTDRSNASSRQTFTGTWAIAVVAGFLATLSLIACGSRPASLPRVISLSPSATETLYSIDAGSEVVAVDSESTFPSGIPVKNDLSAFHPRIEALEAYKPDLVILEQDAQDPDGKSIISELNDQKIKYLLQPTPRTLDDAFQQMVDLGQSTGHHDSAVSLVSNLRAEIDKIFSDTPKQAKYPKYYHEIDTSYYTVSSQSFIGSIYQKFGLRSIGDALDGSGSGYPSASSSEIVNSNPDIIFLADSKCCGQRLSTVVERPGWKSTSAVTLGRVVELDDDIASRWGPRMVDLAAKISDVMKDYKP